MADVTIEFFGVPRLRAGRAELRVQADTAAQALALCARRCPGLAEVCANGRLAPAYLVSLDGERFLVDLGERLRPGDRLLLLSADAGG